MSELHLDSLEIKNFRCFEHLMIEKLGRVNLIVGKNSVGKTCLLEALLVYATRAHFPIIQKILSSRNEFIFTKNNPVVINNFVPFGADFLDPATLSRLIKALRYVFFGRQLIINKTKAYIKTNGSDLSFKLRLSMSDSDLDEAPIDVNSSSAFDQILQEKDRLEWGVLKSASKFQRVNTNSDINLVPGRVETISGITLFPKDQLEVVVANKLIEVHTLFVPHGGLSIKEMENLWNAIALTDAENEVIDILRSVSANIERIGFVSDSQADMEHYPMAKIKGRQEPVPLGQLGEGINRALGLALALVNTSNGYLLIDEFETGLHYSVQTEMWRLVFKHAKRLNIQIFATTHSWNCIEAFQEAAAENQNEEAMLIRLQKKKSGDGIIPVLYDKKSLTIATEDNIEVR
ncbi:MAG: AAA family ATPase [Gammaproteobacteria bacterium]